MMMEAASGSAALLINGQGAEVMSGRSCSMAIMPPTVDAAEPATVTPIWMTASNGWGSC